MLACLIALSSTVRGAIQEIPLHDVRVTGGFWRSWLDRNRRATLPHILRMLDQTGVREAFRRAAGLGQPIFDGFHNSDEVMYKTVEALSYEFLRSADPALKSALEVLVQDIVVAQDSDGYLCTPAQIFRRRGLMHPRFSATRPLVHELYLFGHLYEAGVAHYLATGNKVLLTAALRNADLVERTFGPTKSRDVPQHPNIEQALIALWQVTGDRRYLSLAHFLVAERGRADGHSLWGEFAQDHKPIEEQDEAVGHAVRATYLYSAVADLVTLGAAVSFEPALGRIWQDIVESKLYLHGGIGSRPDNEGFGAKYELPNDSAYAETCAAISFMMWNWRLFLLSGEGKYLDLFERTLYNNFLAGTSLSGDRFFYANPLESDGLRKFNRGWISRDATGPYVEGAAERKEWFYCPCCPPNWSRWLARLPAFIYARDERTVYVNLFATSEARLSVAGTLLRVAQTTFYPWSGRIQVVLHPSRPSRFRVAVRVPGWARGRPVPSDLYRYASPTGDLPVSVTINRRRVEPRFARGFAWLERLWRPKDEIVIRLPMPVNRVQSHRRLLQNEGRLALERGPLLYCIEAADHDGSVRDVWLHGTGRFRPVYAPGLLGGVTILKGTARRTTGAVVRLRAIPYYAWANRGAGEMLVWIPERQAVASGQLPHP
jgi:DUF1680 family protein